MTTYLSQGDLAGARALITAALTRTDPKTLIVRFATFQEMMWVLPDDLRARVVDLQPADFDNDRAMWALKVGDTYHEGNDAKARCYAEISAAAYADVARKSRTITAAGTARPGAGPCRQADGSRASRRAILALRGTAQDAVNGPYYKYQVARILFSRASTTARSSCSNRCCRCQAT